MKILPRIALVFVIPILFIFCSKDDGPTETETNVNVFGTWELTELNITPPQDIDGDGNTTGNILTELNCVSGSLEIRSDNTWNLTFNGVNITRITGGLFNISCTNFTSTTSGTWQLQNTRLTLFQGTTSIFYTVNGDILTNNLGEDLPEIRSEVYQKQ